MIVPQLGSQHFRTYQIVAPRSTHSRPATCEEVECSAWRSGWVTMLPADDPRADYIRTQSGRAFTEGKEAGMVTFTFPAGQKCFAAASHRMSLERDPIFVARDGDARGNPTGIKRVHTRADHWVEDCSEHLDKVRRNREG